ncbi:M14 family metallopeptidase [Daejeonella sp. JGW-45]|uniref:succinylglutamate desuccinylase/aspartoacylase family protein n=1 Tax=Daejeonella sp. JGW-45 TaxID=3034148 RepID=UPI0023EA8FF9|nr:M14 family metallopeptidase [Daejeonella sp. JGW-45]
MEDNKLVKFYRVDSGKAGPRVLLTAGVHGDEYEPMLAAMQLVNEVPGLLKSGSVTIVPLTNETAYVNGIRYGEDGLDLARICPGKSDGTITERVASEISALIKESDYFIDMHTGGPAFEIYPLAGYVLHPSPEILEKQQEMALAFNLPLVWGTDYRPDGRTLSVARDANIPAIYLEFGGGTGFRMQVVNAYKTGFMRLLNYLNMLNGPAGSDSFVDKYWIEDHRQDSGYLQGKMPSPVDGIFVAEVKIGDKIKAGELFGKVVESFSGKQIDMYADIDGLVFLLRAMVKVKPGDALGGILPIGSLNERVIYE